MAHGFSATRSMTIDKYAEAFCANGFAVLLYDHRGFGASGGEPRLEVNPWTQTMPSNLFRGPTGSIRTVLPFGATV